MSREPRRSSFQHPATQAAFLIGALRDAVQVCVKSLFGKDGMADFAAESKKYFNSNHLHLTYFLGLGSYSRIKIFRLNL